MSVEQWLIVGQFFVIVVQQVISYFERTDKAERQRCEENELGRIYFSGVRDGMAIVEREHDRVHGHKWGEVERPKGSGDG